MSGLGDCFESALRVAQEIEGAPENDPGVLEREVFVVHALPVYQGEGAAPEPGGRFWHAWVEVESVMDLSALGHGPMTTRIVEVVDRSNGKDVRLPSAVVYGMGRLNDEDAPPVRRYRVEAAWATAVRHGHWGPWPEGDGGGVG